MRIVKIIFSPTGGTQRVADMLAEAIPGFMVPGTEAECHFRILLQNINGLEEYFTSFAQSRTLFGIKSKYFDIVRNKCYNMRQEATARKGDSRPNENL